MFSTLKPLPADPILNLVLECNQDNNPNKVDLGAGVYKDETGITPIMQAVLNAQSQWQGQESTKTYITPAGLEGFNEGISQLLLGANHPALRDQRVISVQTPGGCGALNVAGHLIKRCHAETNELSAAVWVSTPTWANHIPLLGGCGLTLKEYAYYDYEKHTLDFDAMINSLAEVAAGDVVLLHGCCHNPSGADLSKEQWRVVAELLNEKGAIPFVDIAYQGLGDGLDEDAYGLRYVAEHCPEVIIASSCSKNFGLYRERVGAVLVVANTASEAVVSRAQLLSIARGIYSMPPSHGAAIVDLILNNDELHQQWKDELDTMRQRIAQLRDLFVKRLSEAGAGSRFDYIRHEKGMFSFLGISSVQVEQLKKESSIYMVNSSRINVAGLSDKNIDYIVHCLMKCL